MSFSLYQASVPVFARALRNLAAILDKGVTFAEAKKIDPSVLLNSRLAPDMFPLTRQVQIACDAAKNGTARLAGLEPPAMPDTETSFQELHERIQKTLGYIESIPADQIDGHEGRAITLKLRSTNVDFTGQSLLLSFTLPNLYFHVTTAYAILRHNGVELGKLDFLGGV
jgi:hypothetical protein